MSDSNIAAQLAESSLFKAFPPQTLEKLAASMKKEIYPKGTVLFKKGDPASKLFVIVSGQIALLSSKPNGQDVVVALLGEGEVLGEMSLLTGEPRNVTARLDATTSFLTLEKEDFDSIMVKDPTMALHLSRILSHRLAWTNEQAAGLKAENALRAPRLYFFLTMLDEGRGPIFALNLAVSLLEQTRKKVALVEFCAENKSRFLTAINQSKTLPEPKQFQEKTPKEIVNSVKTTHASGIDIITLPPGLAGAIGSWDGMIALMNYLRSQYDFTLIFVSPLSWESVRPIFTEADFSYIVSRIDDPSRATVTDRLMMQPGHAENILREILIAPDGRDSFVARHKIRIGWAKDVDKTYEQERNPFKAMAFSRTTRAIDRLARILGNLKIGIALGSGGALGYSIPGVMRVLAREKIYPDIIAGTSIGALAGAMLAKGMTPEEMLEFGMQFDRKLIREVLMWDLSLPKDGGFLLGVRLMRFLRKVFDDLTFEDLEIPMTCVAGDIITGEEVQLNSGNLLDAIRGSISVPIVFKPHKMGDKYLVDGGMVNPVPTSVLVQMGADILISVQLTHSPSERRFSVGLLGKTEERTGAPGVVDVFFRTMLTMMHKIATNKQDLSHVNIHPSAPDYHWTDFDKSKELIEVGEKAAIEALPRIKALLPFYSDYCATRLRT